MWLADREVAENLGTTRNPPIGQIVDATKAASPRPSRDRDGFDRRFRGG
jgi:hypothetical protein